jgi:hypothetical protein
MPGNTPVVIPDSPPGTAGKAALASITVLRGLIPVTGPFYLGPDHYLAVGAVSPLVIAGTVIPGKPRIVIPGIGLLIGDAFISLGIIRPG